MWSFGIAELIPAMCKKYVRATKNYFKLTVEINVTK
jgi:hypothetical protein